MLPLKTLVPTLHEQALDAAKRFRKAEADLIEILQRVDDRRLYLQFECRSLFDYCVNELHLSESVAYNLITVSRKAREVLALKAAIQRDELSVSKARKITPVLKPSNQALWLNKAKNLDARRLELEVAQAQPLAARRDRARYINGSLVELRVSLKKETYEKLKRVQELINQKKRKACDFDEDFGCLTRTLSRKRRSREKSQKGEEEEKDRRPVTRQEDR